MCRWRPSHATLLAALRGAASARAERGAILVQTAIMMIGLTAFSAFVVDYGVLWTARRQIQNSADAAALAAAISLGIDAPGDQAAARQNALIAAGANPVWGVTPDIGPGDVTFPACPTGSVGGGSTVCVRVEAFRNQRSSKVLPTVFAHLFNVTEQGVRATATAQVLYGSSSDCVKPFAVPDRWNELRGNLGPAGWDVQDTFEHFRPNGQPLPGVVDVYEPPGASGNGTGFSRGRTPWTNGDYGMRLDFAPADLTASQVLAGAESFLPVHVSPGGSFLDDITSCAPRVVRPGDALQVEPANINAQMASGVQSLIDQDAAAVWNPSLNGGRGGVSGGCMSSGACTVSPRIVALPVFNPDAWNATPANTTVVVSRVVGFFIDHIEGGGIIGQLMVYPAAPRSTMTADPQSAFIVSAALVR